MIHAFFLQAMFNHFFSAFMSLKDKKTLPSRIKFMIIDAGELREVRDTCQVINIIIILRIIVHSSYSYA